MTTYCTPKSANATGDVSPVNAPLSSKYAFCAPIFNPSALPSLTKVIKASSWIVGAQITDSTWSVSGNVGSSLTKSFAS